MATSKTLTPTNVTISIPEFTDQPDQRVNSNCIDKEADAINKINTEATNTNIGSFATLAGLATLLDTMLGDMQSAGVKSFQTNATATVDPFVSGLTYMGTIFKSGTNTSFAYVELRPISENKKIIGRRQSGGGYTWAELLPTTTSESFPADQQSGGIYFIRSGNVRQIVFDDAKLPANNAYFTFTTSTLAASDRPKVVTTAIMRKGSGNELFAIWIRQSGTFGQGGGTAGAIINGTLTWVV